MSGLAETNGEEAKSPYKEDGSHQNNSCPKSETVGDITCAFEMSDNDIAEDFNCSVCFRLSVHPTTLSCGHTSCRLCLAQWYFTSKKKECPLCREVYQGHPKINTQLRNLLLRIVPKQVRQSEKEMSEDIEAKEMLTRYDKELSKDVHSKPVQTIGINIFLFCLGIVCSIVVVYFWQYGDSNLASRKPVEMWTSKDVENWLLKIPWVQSLAPLVIEHEIDGKVLLSLDEDSFWPLMNVTHDDRLLLKAFMYSISTLRELDIKMPVNLWDYKAIYPGRSLFLLYSMTYFPRTAVLYMWVYFYDELFLPFVHATTHQRDDASIPDIAMYNTSDELFYQPNSSVPVSTAMLFEFILYIIFIPQYPVILFTWNMFQYHTFTPIFVLTTAVLFSLQDIRNWRCFLFERNWSWRSISTLGHDLMSVFMSMILWPFIPNLIVDVLFYGLLFVNPVIQLSKAFDEIRRRL